MMNFVFAYGIIRASFSFIAEILSSVASSWNYYLLTTAISDEGRVRLGMMESFETILQYFDKKSLFNIFLCHKK